MLAFRLGLFRLVGFPACENGKIDPTRPQKSWRSAWRSLRKAAGLQHLRFHDLRHHAITELAESQASDQTVMAIAGMSHVKCWSTTPMCAWRLNAEQLKHCHREATMGVTSQNTSQMGPVRTSERTRRTEKSSVFLEIIGRGERI